MVYEAGTVCFGTQVYDVDHKLRIDRVMRVDTDNGVVVCAQIPFHVLNGEVATYTLKFRSIHAIYGGSPIPCLFHCYGEIQ